MGFDRSISIDGDVFCLAPRPVNDLLPENAVYAGRSLYPLANRLAVQLQGRILLIFPLTISLRRFLCLNSICRGIFKR